MFGFFLLQSAWFESYTFSVAANLNGMSMCNVFQEQRAVNSSCTSSTLLESRTSETVCSYVGKLEL